MAFYLLLILAFCLDIITLTKSKNTKDKLPYVISMVCVAVVGFLYKTYGDNFEIAKIVFDLLNINGGM